MRSPGASCANRLARPAAAITYARPICRVVVDGRDITADITARLELTSQLPDGDELTSDASAQYSGVLTWYRDEKTGEQKKITKGDQTNPKRLTHLYASKATAERAVKREIARLS